MLPVSNTVLVSWNTHDISTSIGYYAIIRITSFLKRPKKSSSAAKFCLKSFVSLRAVLSCHDVLQQPTVHCEMSIALLPSLSSGSKLGSFVDFDNFVQQAANGWIAVRRVATGRESRTEGELV